ncbi:sigma-54-dependent Fis family transcriptional regulator [Hymenobacter persicinus]|uniref:Sigma-54-dependent Fis family transcriptional regulator n=1 Tax=Hymenobacter persicinus TaxID=2025506 RepID=A0A4Q5LDN4_9BACT|nr:sigma-54-dependent Fis family transcriptional regulator [Hymenobacter persicinus]RYU80116.1 sigma-54-dependent Fis family transcriptional regulator [Hymenobacter persicinus]
MPNQEESLLLYLNEAIATTRSKEALFRIVTEKLRLIFPFDVIIIITVDNAGNYKRVMLRDYLSDLNTPAAESFQVRAVPIVGTPVERFLTDARPRTLPLPDLVAEYPSFPTFDFLNSLGIGYMTAVPLRTGGQVVGVLCLASRRSPQFAEPDLALLEKIGSLVAVAVSNTLAFEEVERREREKTMQLAVNNALLSLKERSELFRTVATEINRVIPCDFFGVRVQQKGSVKAFAEFAKQPDGDFTVLDPNRWDHIPEYQVMQAEAFELFFQPAIYNGPDYERLSTNYRLMQHIQAKHGTKSMMAAPLGTTNDQAAALILARHHGSDFQPADLALLMSLAPQIALAMRNLFAFEQIETLRTQLEQERTYLIDEINTTGNFEDFVGQSTVMQQVQTRIAQVAPTDTTVLISGETGTGKELVARALHNLSPRQDRALIKLNCAALPAQLIESELFGHEKGAFTGAHDRRIGKFELADGGTIFLDEIGELPLDLQAKLLRVLQEKEFERIGGRRVIHTDVRVIAATNRVLEDEVAAGRFRADLYYRLNVFPIRLPALRERPEDIEPLMRHFLERFTKQLAKPVRGLRERDLRAMQQYSWPGNIRELEHVLEQAVIVSSGAFLEFAGFSAVAQQAAPAAAPDHAPIKTLRDQERDHILAALHRTGGRVSGPHGAAVLLDINPKTLEARMKKLGIRRTVGVES